MLTALLLAADLAGTLAVSDRTELRARMPGAASAAAAMDAETAITADLTLATRRWGAFVSYTPRFTLWDVGTSRFAPTSLQGGRVRLDWTGRRVRLSLEQSASYGGVSFLASSLGPGPEGQPPRVDAIPTAQIINIVSSTTALGARLELRRWTLATSVGYRLAGGADAPARLLLPREAGPYAEATADYAAWRRDHLVTKVSAAESTFSSGPEDLLVEVDQGYRHLWTRFSETRLSVGVAEARVRPTPASAAGLTTYPVLEGTFERHPGARGGLDLSVIGRLGPTVNRLVGLVEQRVQGTIMASHHHRRFTTRLFASAAQALPVGGTYATSLFAGELGLAYDASSIVTVDTGTRAMWQRLGATGVPVLQGMVFAGVSVKAPRVRW